MSRMFITEGTGSSQMLNDVQDEKIPIYANKTAMEADASNIPDGAIVFTKSDHDDVIDQMKEYIRNQNVLSDFEDITISTDANNPTEMRYDGFLLISVLDGRGTTPYVNIDGTQYLLTNNNTDIGGTTVNIPIKKGQKVYLILAGLSISSITCRLMYYKLRDYSDRT